jgi:hypothetical protein
MSVFAWGTPAGWVVTAFAVATHVVSAADAIRQGAFPGFGRWVPFVSASAGLGLACYAPALAVASVLAWPGERTGNPRERFLINLWAYRERGPETGHWVWFEHPDGDGRAIGRLLASEGQSVEWSGGRLRVNGAMDEWSPRATAATPRDLALTVPPGHALIAPYGADPGEPGVLGTVLIDSRRILGRAWAQHYPVWNRRLLR